MENDSTGSGSIVFAPHLTIHDVGKAIEYYKKAFNARELRRFINDNGSVHVAEMEIGGNIFHIHEDSPEKGEITPEQAHGTTVIIELWADNPDSLFDSALAAGGREISPMQDYEYGYRQGRIADPFGHIWMLQKRI